MQLSEVNIKLAGSLAAYVAPARDPTPNKWWSHSAEAMKQNLLVLNTSFVIDPLPREGDGMSPVFYQSHLVPSTAALPRATQTTLKNDLFHSQDEELETWLL